MLSAMSDGTTDGADGAPMKAATGRWTKEEHAIFVEGMRKHPRQWKSISLIVKTRTLVQVRTHAQKCWTEEMANGGCADLEDSSFATPKKSTAAAAKQAKAAAAAAAPATGAAAAAKGTARKAGGSAAARALGKDSASFCSAAGGASPLAAAAAAGSAAGACAAGAASRAAATAVGGRGSGAAASAALGGGKKDVVPTRPRLSVHVLATSSGVGKRGASSSSSDDGEELGLCTTPTPAQRRRPAAARQHGEDGDRASPQGERTASSGAQEVARRHVSVAVKGAAAATPNKVPVGRAAVVGSASPPTTVRQCGSSEGLAEGEPTSPAPVSSALPQQLAAGLNGASGKSSPRAQMRVEARARARARHKANAQAKALKRENEDGTASQHDGGAPSFSNTSSFSSFSAAAAAAAAARGGPEGAEGRGLHGAQQCGQQAHRAALLQQQQQQGGGVPLQQKQGGAHQAQGSQGSQERQQDARASNGAPAAKRARLAHFSGMAPGGGSGGTQQSGPFSCVESLPSGFGRGVDDMDDSDMCAFFGTESPLGFSPTSTPSPPLSPSIGRSMDLPEKRMPLVTDSWHGMLSLSGLL